MADQAYEPRMKTIYRERIRAAMNKASNGGIIGSVLIRTENDNGQEEFASDCFVTQFDHGAASRQDMQGKSCNIRLTGALEITASASWHSSPQRSAWAACCARSSDCSREGWAACRSRPRSRGR